MTTKEIGFQSFTGTPEQVALVKQTVAKDCTDDQLALFLYTCKKTGLDPLIRQIHAVVRKTNRGPVMAIQTGIDGLRLVADRTNNYAGSDEPVYEKDSNGLPVKATVTVWKIVQGMRVAFTASALFDEFNPGGSGGFMWSGKPFLMLGKCAEAQALRKAFPADMDGLYSKEELDKPETGEPELKSPQPITVDVVKPKPIPTTDEVPPAPDGDEPSGEEYNGDVDQVFVKDWKSLKTGKTKKGKAWELILVTLSDGTEASSIDANTNTFVKAYKLSGKPVVVAVQDGEKGKQITEIQGA